MIKRINKSLYLKIVLLLGISYLIFFTLTIRTQKYLYFRKHFRVIQQNSYHYATLLLEKIKTQNTFEEIETVLQQYAAKMRIITPDSVYSFPASMREINFEEKDFYNQNTMVGFDQGLVVRIIEGNKTYEMILQQKDSSLDYFLFIYRSLSFFYFLVMLIIVYYMMVLLLNPINKLHKNVKEMTRENLDKPLFSRRTDELGELINSFNEMKQAIKNMIRSREQLLLDVSHELRTPLTRTNLSLEMMEDCEEKKDIVTDVREMETMISELLESAKIQSKHGELNLEKVNIIDLIEDVALYFENEKPGLDLSGLPEKVLLKVDPERIKIMLKNIMSNALKYSADEAAPVKVTAEPDKNWLTLKVKNFGVGIPEEELGFIFEPFYRVEKSRNKKTGGYGLGMHLVKKIIEAHRGEIHISSMENEWTEVTVKLPV